MRADKIAHQRGFNTQPPEGGWSNACGTTKNYQSFNTQPPEGGWAIIAGSPVALCSVSTHSRLKAAGRFAFAV